MKKLLSLSTIIALLLMACRDEMAWIRRRLRMIRMKQWKTYKAMHKEMRRQSINQSINHNGDKMNVILWKNSKVHLIDQVIP